MTTQYTEQQLADDVNARGLNAPRITSEHLDSVIAGEQFYVFPGTTMTVCLLTLKNGFGTIGYSASASPENFDPEIGRNLARQHARDRIWQLEGYLLRQRLHDSGS